MKKRLKILIVEDHPLMVKGIRGVIEDCNDMEVTGEATSLKQAREYLRNKGAPDVVLVDITLPDGIGFDLIPEIKSRFSDTKIVILTAHREEPYLIKAIQNGAAGFVLKDMVGERLIDAIKLAVGGHRCYFSAITSSANPSQPTIRHELPRPLPSLSKREEYVLRALAQGKSLTEIASNLGISVKTVFTYRVRILQKLQLQSNSDIVRYAIDNGLSA